MAELLAWLDADAEAALLAGLYDDAAVTPELLAALDTDFDLPL
jgi:hypothetical protein